MIPFDFVYCRPDTLEEAVSAHRRYAAAGKEPYFYGGGSEIITMSRSGSIRPGAVIDIKGLPSLGRIEKEADALCIGAGLSLSEIAESKCFPLLGTAAGRIADHTNQNRITLGGNLKGAIVYRETALPLLLCDAELLTFGPAGHRRAAIGGRMAQGRLQLMPGECITGVRIPDWALQAPYFHVKKTAGEKIDYPLVTVAGLRFGGKWRFAFSGLLPYPFRSAAIEEALNDEKKSAADRTAAAAGLLPTALGDTAASSGDYRLFLCRQTLKQAMETEEWHDDRI